MKECRYCNSAFTITI